MKAFNSWLPCSHVQMWEQDHKEGWGPKNWCYWTVVLEKTFESPLDCKEIQPVNPKGNQPWIFTGRTDAEAPVLWPLDGKRQLIGKDPDAGKDWRQEEKGTTVDEMVGWHHQLNGHEFEEALGDGEGQGSLVCCSPWGHKGSDTTEQLNNNSNLWNVQYIHRQQKPHWSQFPGMSAGTERFCRVEQRCYNPSPLPICQVRWPLQPFPQVSNRKHILVWWGWWGHRADKSKPTKGFLSGCNPIPGAFSFLPGKKWNDITLINIFHWTCLIRWMSDLQNGKSCSLLSWTIFCGDLRQVQN